MSDFYDVKNTTKGPMLFGSVSIEPGETMPLYLTDKQYQKFNDLGWVVGVNASVTMAYSVGNNSYVTRPPAG